MRGEEERKREDRMELRPNIPQPIWNVTEGRERRKEGEGKREGKNRREEETKQRGEGRER